MDNNELEIRNEGGSLPLAPTADAFSATSSAGDDSGTAFAETRSKTVSQVLTASPSLPTRKAPQIICLTGQMAAGKNFICSQMEASGFVSLDLDKTAHEAINLCTPEILQAFGAEAEKRGISLLNGDGSLNRRALGQIVFPDKELLSRQENIVYPKIIQITTQYIEENREKSVILNATVLFKTPELLSKCGKILFIKANFLKRLYRAKKRDGMPLRHILARFKSQKNLFDEYKKAADKFNIPIEIIKN
ncbi:dephospho-CoA kinase [Treponema ruminis]|uniref:Dephospho-CoA kinase n=1 Tax=Treponema ruminis TaxID=744515 RepID=A0A7W8GB53_9SPIR|nr:dephospho-CoA kinase [Treponema ruminis]MBB5227198.1 dephospho-CoA kinase [Treponema ruminis]QSI01573.1 dephospho-CoA kinase [Treponema ruminis]